MNPLKKQFSKLVLCFALLLIVSVKIAEGQVCSGSWAVGLPLNWGCFFGVNLNQNNNLEPIGCPVNPTYTSEQTNTFTFDNPVSSFAIDFKGFSTESGCARLQVKINGVFYQLNSSNIIDIPSLVGCTGSLDFIILTTDGYISSTPNSQSFSNGHGRIIITGVNATSVTISTNDPAGTAVSSPFNCLPLVPLKLESFTGIDSDCKALLNWTSGTELNIKNIEVQRSEDGIIFNKAGEVAPKGSDSKYAFIADNLKDAYFRLKINDLDDSYENSEILYLKSSCNKNYCNIIPNPAVDYVEIVGLKSTDHVSVSDMLGKIVLLFDGCQNNKLNIQSLSRGMYIIKVFNAGTCKATLKLIKH